ncbi:aminotransferase class V-fold PLP-dependent enzyme [candidate division GN15 bacterium]|nr:aminotransferase class V-fold PLP-dependent enzyme [candidate division GN15 bacterium]
MRNCDQQVYLNNAATSFPKPARVIRAVTEYLQSVPVEPGRTCSGAPWPDMVASCRSQLATLLHARSDDNIVFTSGATESINLAVRGLALEGAHVITTVVEHNSLLRPLRTLESDGVISLSIVDCDATGYVEPEAILEHIQPDTRLIAMSHASNVTGRIQDIVSIGPIAREHGILSLFDASQSVGVAPIDLQKLQVDLLAFTGHKSLWGMPGIGGLYVRDGLYLEPLKTGGTGTHSHLPYQPEHRPLLYEAGTLNLPGIVSLAAGIDEILEIGPSALYKRARQQRQKLLMGFREMPGVTVQGSTTPGDDSLPLLSFTVAGHSPEEIGYMLEQSFGVVSRTGLHCAPLIHRALGTFPEGTVRLSPSWLTTDEELAIAIDALQRITTAGVRV